MANLLKFGLNILADVFYPKYCFGCGRAGGYLCKFCVTQLPLNARSFCVACNNPSPGGFTHRACQTALTPDRLLSVFPYQHPVVADMIIAGKYYFISEVYSVLGLLAAQWLTMSRINFDGFVLCPIPLHAQRLRWRGFNQSEIIAQTICQATGVPCNNLLKRQKNTKTQKDLDAATRRANMTAAFVCQSAVPRAVPQKVILIDDVTTTGQTFLEATKVLKQHGAQVVWCISVAKD